MPSTISQVCRMSTATRERCMLGIYRWKTAGLPCFIGCSTQRKRPVQDLILLSPSGSMVVLGAAVWLVYLKKMVLFGNFQQSCLTPMSCSPNFLSIRFCGGFALSTCLLINPLAFKMTCLCLVIGGAGPELVACCTLTNPLVQAFLL